MRFVRGSLTTLLVGGLLGLPITAQAAPGHPGVPLDDVPRLRSEPGPFGAISLPNVSTVPNGTSGVPAGSDCGDAQGAAAFRTDDLDEPARLELRVSELDVDGLCAVGVYRDGVGSLYDVPGRAPFTLIEPVCAAICTLAARLEPGISYIVVWPRGSGDVSRDVSIDGTLRGFPSLSSSLSGTDIADRCKRIDKGESTTLRYDVVPTPLDPADRVVAVSRIDRRTGTGTDLGTHPLDENGEGSLVIPGVARGYHDVIVRFDGSLTRTPRQVGRCLAVRGPSKLDIRTRGERYRYDDYAVWRDGDRMVFRLPVFPWPPGANGELNVRIERNVGNHRYIPWDVRKGIEVEDGLAVLRMKAVYRSNGLPFYRMRTEWPGSNTHAPATSKWICFQVNP